MTAQEYIEAELQKLSEPVVTEEVDPSQLEDAIFARVMSKKFRKLKADEDGIHMVKKAISIAVRDNKPVAFNTIFGGNKLWSLEEAPEVDWAELLYMIYMGNWLKSVASVYPPGAWLEFYSEDVVLEVLNNLPKLETDRYSETFVELLEWMKQYLPANVTMTYRRYGDDYESYNDFLKELDDAVEKVSKELDGKLPVMDDAQKAATELNVKLKPGQDDDPQWREKVELIHQSIEATETAERYFGDATYIQTCPTQYPACITTGSTKKSYAKFWAAVGALEPKENVYNALVLTPSQLKKADYKWQTVHLTDLQGKNFSKIRVLS